MMNAIEPNGSCGPFSMMEGVLENIYIAKLPTALKKQIALLIQENEGFGPAIIAVRVASTNTSKLPALPKVPKTGAFSSIDENGTTYEIRMESLEAMLSMAA
jgi:hypothetical protein